MESIYGDDLELFRDTVREFFRREVEPRAAHFEAHGTDREFWHAAGRYGLLGVFVPESYGGPGADPLAIMIVSEELGRHPVGALIGSSLNGDMTTHFMVANGTEEQKRRWLPGVLTGDVVQATALTEPESGSDAAALRTTALRQGNEYVLNGSKCFISNGCGADLLYVLARTDPAARGGGISMILVPGDTPGVSRRKVKTMGFAGGDTAEIFFQDARVPAANLLGREGEGLRLFQPCISLDRMQICARSLGAAQGAFDLTLEHVKQRRIFGQRLIDMQNTQFKLAEVETDIRLGRAFMGELVRKFRAGTLTDVDTSMLKIWMPEMEFRALDTCLQFWGGSGFMDANPLARMFTAARVQRVYAGATELQKALVARRYLK